MKVDKDSANTVPESIAINEENEEGSDEEEDEVEETVKINILDPMREKLLIESNASTMRLPKS